MEPKEFLEYAKNILEGDGDQSEAGFRTCINRAYYSLYHESTKVVAGLPWELSEIEKFKRKEDALPHFEVIKRLKAWRHSHSGALVSSSIDALYLANALASSLSLRKVADYNLKEKIGVISAKEQLQRVRGAKKFLVRIQKQIEKHGI